MATEPKIANREAAVSLLEEVVTVEYSLGKFSLSNPSGLKSPISPPKTSTPVQKKKEKTARISQTTLSRIEIANSLSLTGAFETEELKISFSGPLDSGSDVDLVSASFVARLGNNVQRIILEEPIRLESIEGQTENYVREKVVRLIRINDEFMEFDFAITEKLHLAQDVIFGLPWLKRYRPKAIAEINFGNNDNSNPRSAASELSD